VPELIVGIFPITKNLKPLFLAIAGGVLCSLDGRILRHILVGNGPDRQVLA